MKRKIVLVSNNRAFAFYALALAENEAFEIIWLKIEEVMAAMKSHGTEYDAIIVDGHEPMCAHFGQHGFDTHCGDLIGRFLVRKTMETCPRALYFLLGGSEISELDKFAGESEWVLPRNHPRLFCLDRTGDVVPYNLKKWVEEALLKVTEPAAV